MTGVIGITDTEGTTGGHAQDHLHHTTGKGVIIVLLRGVTEVVDEVLDGTTVHHLRLNVEPLPHLRGRREALEHRQEVPEDQLHLREDQHRLQLGHKHRLPEDQVHLTRKFLTKDRRVRSPKRRNA